MKLVLSWVALVVLCLSGCFPKDSAARTGNLTGTSSSHPDDYSKLVEAINLYIRRILGGEYDTVGEDLNAALEELKGEERNEFVKLIGLVQREIEGKSSFSVINQQKFIKPVGPGDFSNNLIRLLTASRLHRLASQSPDPASADLFRADAALIVVNAPPDSFMVKAPSDVFDDVVKTCMTVVDKRQGVEAPSVPYCGTNAVKVMIGTIMLDYMYKRHSEEAYHVKMATDDIFGRVIMPSRTEPKMAPRTLIAAEEVFNLYAKLIEKNTEESRAKSLKKHNELIGQAMYGDDYIAHRESVTGDASIAPEAIIGQRSGK